LDSPEPGVPHDFPYLPKRVMLDIFLEKKTRKANIRTSKAKSTRKNELETYQGDSWPPLGRDTLAKLSLHKPYSP